MKIYWLLKIRNLGHNLKIFINIVYGVGTRTYNTL